MTISVEIKRIRNLLEGAKQEKINLHSGSSGNLYRLYFGDFVPVLFDFVDSRPLLATIHA